MDLEVTRALTIPEVELGWRFSRSSGPGGQHVNTTDTRVELTWNIAESAVLAPTQRARLLERLAKQLVGGAVVVTAAETRSQFRNREIALQKLAALISGALGPGSPRRRPTRRTRGSNRRRLAAKAQRSEVKKNRRRPAAE